MINGFLAISKPHGITSHQCVAIVKKKYHAKVGHTGTLDPMATGAMILSLNDATKFSQWIIARDKAYTATIKLGQQTSTDDATGQTINEQTPPSLTITQITEVLSKFTGEINQVPPKFSAIHINGKRAYKLARAEASFELPTRLVTIHSNKLIHYNKTTSEIIIETHCGSGTYIRSLARDIGHELGTYAHLNQLHRRWVAPFQNNTYIPLDNLPDTPPIISLEEAFSQYPRINLTQTQTQNLIHGKQISTENKIQNTPTTAFYNEQFIGMLTFTNHNTYKSIKLINTKHITL
ncbi:tRNA pseudouridine(55) synthase TruB [Candidatus Comchoanobacter bicostacola]|uniref:tRNA pseudouridine synthase B n=1 Tax=Candidatus Comchoanobacter bicostacola TaxID=2919598 RepID=A0ABY5DK11_9GAMM|nr:tRNA pseudouridine(55) synthase TruB [Candidatus Comchoanobacter bicostacola]UTC24823.1 tRNA pseudouridine(55) synthase TruB [Candidatus Comchoanobacter bicostacola]